MSFLFWQPSFSRFTFSIIRDQFTIITLLIKVLFWPAVLQINLNKTNRGIAVGTKKDWLLFRVLPAVFYVLTIIPQYAGYFFMAFLLLYAFPDFLEQYRFIITKKKFTVGWSCTLWILLIFTALTMVLLFQGNFFYRTLIATGAVILEDVKR